MATFSFAPPTTETAFERDVALFCDRLSRKGQPMTMGQPMTDTLKSWDPSLVRTWLERRMEAARLDQAAADRRGYSAQDDYDKAAGEEWACRALHAGNHADDQAAFAARIKGLLAEDDYRTTGIYDDRRFERNVRATLRKIAKMTKANDGFANVLRYQD